MGGKPAESAAGTEDGLDEAALVDVSGQIAALPPMDPLCPFCVVLRAEAWPEYADEKLCVEHLAAFRALQCKGWNADRWHQHLAGLARHGRLPEPTDWWPDRR
jgi:hypothetical protein